jgi:hypothetical protein
VGAKRTLQRRRIGDDCEAQARFVGGGRSAARQRLLKGG